MPSSTGSKTRLEAGLSSVDLIKAFNVALEEKKAARLNHLEQ
jgi:hypothetical protein